MPAIKLVKKLKESNSYNFKYVIDKYDLDINNFSKEWDLNFILPEKWSVGLIVGNSGSGKSLISREIFEKVYDKEIVEKKDVPLVEAFGDQEIEKIIQALNSVGMGSVPEWITPYNLLSTGQKMRADLAYCLLNDEKIIVYDEFTSVVDRQVAKIISHSISKAFKKTEKQFVAISCHHDIEEWLEPDWVLDMDLKEFRTLKKKDQKFLFKSDLAIDQLGNFSKVIII